MAIIHTPCTYLAALPSRDVPPPRRRPGRAFLSVSPGTLKILGVPPRSAIIALPTPCAIVGPRSTINIYALVEIGPVFSQSAKCGGSGIAGGRLYFVTLYIVKGSCLYLCWPVRGLLHHPVQQVQHALIGLTDALEGAEVGTEPPRARARAPLPPTVVAG